jgi:hypothetical protein
LFHNLLKPYSAATLIGLAVGYPRAVRQKQVEEVEKEKEKCETPKDTTS